MSYYFNAIFSLLTEQNSNPTDAKLSILGQRKRPTVYTMSSPGPGELFNGGSYFFDVGAKRGGGGGS